MRPSGLPRKIFRKLLKGIFLTGIIVILVLVLSSVLIWFFFIRNSDLPDRQVPARAWNIVHDMYYDASSKRFRPGDEFLDEFLKKPAGTNVMVPSTKTVQALLRTLDDRFTRLVTPEEFAHALKVTTSRSEYKLLGFTVDEARVDNIDNTGTGSGAQSASKKGLKTLVLGCYRVDEVQPGSQADYASLEQGDCIYEVNGSSVGMLTYEQMERLMDDGSNQIRLEMRVKSADGLTKVVAIDRDPDTVNPIEFSLLDKGTCYVKIRTFLKLGVASELEHALRSLTGCENYLLDLRGNRGGFVTEAIRAAGLFIEQGRLGSITARVPGRGYINLQVTLTERSLSIRPGHLQLGLPLARFNPAVRKKAPIFILVDRHTASAAEAFTAMLQENSVALVAGKGHTYGKGIGQTWFPLANGYWLSITNFYLLTPKGNWAGDGCQLVCNGIEPDIVLNTPQANSQEGELELALVLLKNFKP